MIQKSTYSNRGGGFNFLHRFVIGFFLLCILVQFSVMAQVPQAIKYQTVLRSLSGQVLVNRPVQFGITLKQGYSGATVYEERHSTSTNAEGLVTIEVGRGVLVNNSPLFSTIDWSVGNLFQFVSVDTSMTNTYSSIGGFELLSVPYALNSGNGLSSGSQSGQLLVRIGSSWTGVPPGQSNQVLTFCNGIPGWNTDGQCPAIISTLNCSGVVNSGPVVQNAATAITSNINYTGGNSGYYPAQVINSTGVLGLVASLSSGYVQNGSGTLSYQITGTPNGSGTASFSISLGGQSCSFSISVSPVGSIGSFQCGTAVNSGSLVEGIVASSVSTTLSYTSGNGGAYPAQTFLSTGVTGLSATVNSGNFVNGSGSVILTISGTASSSGTAMFSVVLGGQSCVLSRTVVAGNISTLSCGTATHTGQLFQSISALGGVYSSIPYTGGNGGRYSAQSISSTGVTGLTAALNEGNFAVGNGSLLYSISGTPTGNGTASFPINIGSQTCVLTRTVNSEFITSLDCGSAVQSNYLVAGMNISGVSFSVNYTGGNQRAFPSQSVTSTGVTGLTATRNVGTLNNGNGTVVYSISGTPSANGTANFQIQLGGQSCTVSLFVNARGDWKPGTVHCTFTTSVVDVSSPSTGKTWMDRNLGASRVATSSVDNAAFGDLYQWGRPADGHQCRSSDSIATRSSLDIPNHGFFIVWNGSPWDWRLTSNNNLYMNEFLRSNPCPLGYDLPTSSELDAERLSWSAGTAAAAFASPLKLPAAGKRSYGTGLLTNLGTAGAYWSKTSYDNVYSIQLQFSGLDNFCQRAEGASIRCIRR